jgi:hypothetical protein
MFLAYRIAQNFLPEVGRAMEDAAQSALELVKEIKRAQASQGGKLDVAFHNDLEPKMEQLAGERILRLLTEEEKES